MTHGRGEPNGWCLFWTTALVLTCVGCWGVAALLAIQLVGYLTGGGW